jgi:hypothetical protein
VLRFCARRAYRIGAAWKAERNLFIVLVIIVFFVSQCDHEHTGVLRLQCRIGPGKGP